LAGELGVAGQPPAVHRQLAVRAEAEQVAAPLPGRQRLPAAPRRVHAPGAGEARLVALAGVRRLGGGGVVRGRLLLDALEERVAPGTGRDGAERGGRLVVAEGVVARQLQLIAVEPVDPAEALVLVAADRVEVDLRRLPVRGEGGDELQPAADAALGEGER